MANLFFPQLASGALTQYPIRRTQIARTIQNVLPDGTLILYSDPYGALLEWELEYTNLSEADANTLQNFFLLCAGPVNPFTFIDPTGNMLGSSADPSQKPWESYGVSFSSGVSDPLGGNAAFTITNTTQVSQSILQSLPVPSAYQYCFSFYATSVEASEVIALRQGTEAQAQDTLPVGPGWRRLTSGGRLQDSGTTLTVGIILAPGQTVQVYGFQLEAQIVPSPYSATFQAGGIYPNAHWSVQELTLVAEAPDLYATTFALNTVVTS
jgi:hypothetical protein